MACGIDASDEESFVDEFLDILSPYECLNLILGAIEDKSLTQNLRIRAGCDAE